MLGSYPTGGGDRDPAVNQTVLSGDIDASSVLSDNAYHVVSIWDPSFGTTMAVTLDGFTITGGYAISESNNNTDGGMVVTDRTNVTLINLNFYRNGEDGGGGLKFSGESLTLNNVDFSQNRAEGGGGGLLFTGGDLTMNHVNFSRNAGAGGCGGLHFSGVSSRIRNDVNFSRNGALETGDPAAARGGGIYIHSSGYDDPGPLNMTNVTLSGNAANGND